MRRAGARVPCGERERPEPPAVLSGGGSGRRQGRILLEKSGRRSARAGRVQGAPAGRTECQATAGGRALSIASAFHWDPRTRLVYGLGAVQRVGEEARQIGAARVLVVTDPGIVAAGHVERAVRSLEGAGVAAVVFDRVRENPTTLDVDRCLEAARAARIDAIVGLGGGSSLDTAKGCNFLITNGGRMRDYWGVGRASEPLLPLIAIPTTAGTGSECQSFALIADEETHQKMACGDPKAAPRVAILDPELTLSQPRAVAACTGMDALAHAVETAVTRRRTPLSQVFSREAFRLTLESFPRVLERPEDLEARSAMLLGAAFAGMAIELSMLGAAHSCANPLTARFGIIHGQAVGVMLPHVVRFNGRDPAAARAYRDLAVAAGIVPLEADPAPAVEALAGRLEQCLRAAGLAESLAALGVTADAVPALAEGASQQWTARFNPREPAREDFARLYESALAGRPFPG